MKRYIIASLLLIGIAVQAQTVLLEEKVDSVYKKSSYGINSTHYVHMYIDFGFVFGAEEVTKFGNTNSFGLGMRYKLRINNHLATGIDLASIYSNINFPTHGNVKKDKYYFMDLEYNWFIRTNLGMRGSIMGKFIDIGVFGKSNYFSSIYTKIEDDFEDYSTLVYSKEDLKYIETFNYGLLLRVGWNQIVFFSKYRLSNLLKPNVTGNYRDIPRWTIGIQIGLHR